MPASSSVAALPASSEDLRLECAARSAISGRGERSVRGLDIRLDDGVLTLHGQTRTFYEKQLLLHAVQQVRGLAGIVDDVTVSAAASE